MYIDNEFEYGVNKWNVVKWISFPNIYFLIIEFVYDYVKFEFWVSES